MNLSDILNAIEDAPTIMSIDLELKFIEQLSQFSDSELIANDCAFKSILCRLHESHTGGGIFEVTELNLPRFKTFSRRLEDLSETISDSPSRSRLCPVWILGIADDLQCEFF